MRIVVTGREGQIARSLLERGTERAEIVALGRPDLDLTERASVIAALTAARPDAIVNAAAYTAVDRAETEADLAMWVNADGAGFVAQTASSLGVPLVHLSTDYVFDGVLDRRAYRENDLVCPANAYGRSKAAGEDAVLTAHANSAILRTAWVYSPFGANFLRTMLRLGETQPEVSVVADQRGNPTSALDIADAVIAIVARMLDDDSLTLRGTFHMTNAGDATWAEFAEAIFAEAARRGRPAVRVRHIATADYPTLARRPGNSRLDNGKLQKEFGLVLPDWRASLAACVARLIP